MQQINSKSNNKLSPPSLQPARNIPFEEIYDGYYEDIWRFLLHAAANTELALELTSRTFLRACQAWPRFKPQAPVKAWLFQIAINEWRRELRRKMLSRFIPFSSIGEGEKLESVIDIHEVESVNEEIERNETYLLLRKAVAKLPQKYETPILLFYFEHLSYEEAAAILGRPLGTVKSLIHRGIAKLREDQGLREVCDESFSEAKPLTLES